jgi:hypothetical protein
LPLFEISVKNTDFFKNSHIDPSEDKKKIFILVGDFFTFFGPHKLISAQEGMKVKKNAFSSCC